MIETITISSKIDSEFEFEMTAQGVNLQDATVLFQTEINPDIKYDVKCKHVTADRWSVKVPKNLIPNGGYNFKIVVIVEELYFEPVKGILRVVSEETIEVFGVNAKDKPKVEEPKSQPKPKKVEERQSIISSLPKLDETSSTPKAKDTITPKANIPVNEASLNTIQIKEGEGHEDLIRRIIEERKAKLEKVEEQVEEQPAQPVEETIVETPEVTVTPDIEVVPEVTITPTPDLSETVTPTSKRVVSENSIFAENAKKAKANTAVKDILTNIKNPQPTPEVTGTVQPGKFFEEIEELKKLNEKKAKNRAVKDAIEQSKTKK